MPQGLKQQLWVGSGTWENAFSVFQVIWLVARGFGARSEELRARSISHWIDRQTGGGYRACWRGHVWGEGGKDPMCLMAEFMTLGQNNDCEGFTSVSEDII